MVGAPPRLQRHNGEGGGQIPLHKFDEDRRGGGGGAAAAAAEEEEEEEEEESRPAAVVASIPGTLHEEKTTTGQRPGRR